MNIILRNLKLAEHSLRAFIKWVVASLIIGAIGAGIGGIFHLLLDVVTEVRTENPHIIFFLPLSGVVIAAIYHFHKKSGNLDTNRVIEAINTEDRVPRSLTPVIFVSTVITHLFGGSAGREGAAIQLGGSIGYNIGKGLRMDKEDLHTAVMAGVAAVFTALFGTPIAAAVFSVEVAAIGKMQYKAIVPCSVAALSAYAISNFMGTKPVSFPIDFGSIGTDVYVRSALLAILCALLGILFCVSMQKIGRLLTVAFKNVFVKAFIGGAIIVVLTLVLNTQDYNGAGMHVIEKAMQGEASWYAFILKIVFTAITLGAGFKGGEIVPAFFVGSTFGCSIAPLLGLNPVLGSAIGFIALFCSAVNCPLASLFLSVEVFGADAIGIFMLVCAISFMMSGNYSLYRSQRVDL